MTKALVNFQSLEPNQIVNHFESIGVTSKKNLWLSLQSNYRLENGQKHETVFPRCYDLSDFREVEAFTMDFRKTLA